MKIIVSACLLGEPCRYDGASKPCTAVLALQKTHKLIPICPEVAGGLRTPRFPAEIQTDGRVITKDGCDVTKSYKKGAAESLRTAQKNQCSIAILKAKSPSCGKCRIYNGDFCGTLTEGNGICASLFLKSGISVFDETEIEKLNALITECNPK